MLTKKLNLLRQQKQSWAQFKRRTLYVPNLIPIWARTQMTTIRRLIQASNLIRRTQFTFTMYNGLQCLSVK